MKQFLFIITFVLSSLNYFAQTDTIITKKNKVITGTITNVNDTAVFYIDKTEASKYFLLSDITFYVKSGETIIPYTVPSITTTIVQPIKDLTHKTKLIIGVHGGPAGTMRYSGNIFEGNQQPALSFLSGLDLRYNFKPRIAFAIEINYEQKGWMYATSNWRSIYRIGYLTLPLSFNFRINTEDNKVAFYVNTGIYIGYLVKGMFVDKTASGKVSHKYYYTAADLTDEVRFDWGLVTGFGWKIPVNDRFRFLIEVRNNLGLLNLIKPNPVFNYPYKEKNESFALLFGLAYKI